MAAGVGLKEAQEQVDIIFKEKTAAQTNTYCPYCGANVGTKDKFCMKCGKKLSKD